MRPAALGYFVFALYPLFIFAGLQFLNPRTVGLLVLAALVVRYRAQAARLASQFSAALFVALALPLSLGAAVLVTDSELLLRLYPAAITASGDRRLGMLT